MNKSRLEAFSDGVLAIVITIMVLELKTPATTDLNGLRPLVPTFLAYLLSFAFVGIYWANHHHMLHGVKRISSGVLWANLHLLFWLSLTPFVTAWMGENHLASAPVAAYGVVLLASALAWFILQTVLSRHATDGAALREALGRDIKGKLSLATYATAIGLAFVAPLVSVALYACVALAWFIPDRRFERALTAGSD